LAEASEVVLVSASDLLDQSVQPQAFEQARDLARRFVEPDLQVVIAQDADGELAANNCLKEVQIIRLEEIKAGVAADLVAGGRQRPDGTFRRVSRRGSTAKICDRPSPGTPREVQPLRRATTP